MKTIVKWIIGIVILLILLIVISNLGGDKQADTGTDFSGIDTDVDVETGGTDDTGTSDTGSTDNQELTDLQSELDDLEDLINDLESEDLGGLSA